jgi:hypothetical protein
VSFPRRVLKLSLQLPIRCELTYGIDGVPTPIENLLRWQEEIRADIVIDSDVLLLSGSDSVAFPSLRGLVGSLEDLFKRGFVDESGGQRCDLAEKLETALHGFQIRHAGRSRVHL